MSSSESSSAPSPSPPASPGASAQHALPNLERLVLHFVSAKRSLACISYVQRARELVASSRTLIEEVALLNARNTFARRNVDAQLETLDAIRDGVDNVGNGAMAEFSATVRALDEVHQRLEETLDNLRKTVVDASLQGTENARVTADEDADELSPGSSASKTKAGKTLYDFIDESSHKGIVESLHRLMDEFNEAHRELKSDLSRFDDDIREVVDALLAGELSGSGPQEKRTIYDEPPPTIKVLFKGMEERAMGTADLLSSLTKHYDLCVTALKHTDGGGEAAKLAIQQTEELSTKNAAATEESLYRKTVPEPIDEEHRAEMLAVLEGDAEQLDDVTSEIKYYAAEIEGHYQQLSRRALEARRGHQSLCTVLDLFQRLKSTIAVHISASKRFREAWSGIRATMHAKTEELADLTDFYNSFLSSYAKVLSELERREVADIRMKKLASKVQKELNRLYEEDKEARKDFMDEVRDFLPKDIWPGAGDGGVRWDVRQVAPQAME